MLDALGSYVIFDDDLNASSDIKLTIPLLLKRYATSDALANAILQSKKAILNSLPNALHEIESVIDPDDIYNIESEAKYPDIHPLLIASNKPL